MQDYAKEAASLPMVELRHKWATAWNLPPPPHISRKMLETSLVFKWKEQAGFGLTPEQQKRLKILIRDYQRAPGWAIKRVAIQPGTRLVRTWKGRRHRVTVTADGFEYDGQIFASLSKIAAVITGTRWNGWVFFGLKKPLAKGKAA